MRKKSKLDVVAFISVLLACCALVMHIDMYGFTLDTSRKYEQQIEHMNELGSIMETLDYDGKIDKDAKPLKKEKIEWDSVGDFKTIEDEMKSIAKWLHVDNYEYIIRFETGEKGYCDEHNAYDEAEMIAKYMHAPDFKDVAGHKTRFGYFIKDYEDYMRFLQDMIVDNGDNLGLRWGKG